MGSQFFYVGTLSAGLHLQRTLAILWSVSGTLSFGLWLKFERLTDFYRRLRTSCLQGNLSVFVRCRPYRSVISKQNDLIVTPFPTSCYIEWHRFSKNIIINLNINIEKSFQKCYLCK